MAFRASNILPEQALFQAKDLANQLKRFANTTSTALSSQTNSERILSALEGIVNYKARFNAIRSTPGLSQYARDQENDQTYDVATEFAALTASIDDAIAEVVTTFPKDANGFLLAFKLNADGTINYRTLTAAQVSGLKARFDAISAAVS